MSAAYPARSGLNLPIRPRHLARPCSMRPASPPRVVRMRVADHGEHLSAHLDRAAAQVAPVRLREMQRVRDSRAVRAASAPKSEVGPGHTTQRTASRDGSPNRLARRGRRAPRTRGLPRPASSGNEIKPRSAPVIASMLPMRHPASPSRFRSDLAEPQLRRVGLANVTDAL